MQPQSAACPSKSPPWVGIALASVLVLAGLAVQPGGRVGHAVDPSADGIGLDDAACRIVDVVDGDTVGMVCGARARESARLTGFDTPELFSPGCEAERQAAEAARRHMAHLAETSERVGFVREGRDRYGRALVALSFDGRDAAAEMIAAGHARPYDGGRRAGWCAALARDDAAEGWAAAAAVADDASGVSARQTPR
jgi:endonuclease YncB( thermonuclease family)